MNNRKAVVNAISSLLDRKCAGCQFRNEYYYKYGKCTAKLDKYCSKTCSVGKELQELGKQLCRKD